MEFTCDTYIVDAIMGAGKTSAIINMINQSDSMEKFLIITPYLTECKRYIHSCPRKRFKQPIYENGSKMNNIKKLISNGENIVSTHSLFQRFDEDVVSICKAYGYTLILDEVAEVIQEFPVTQYDYDNLINTYVTIKEDTKQLVWREEYKNYTGEFSRYKTLCDLGSLVCYGNSLMVWLFPVSVFNCFTNIYILTYKFNAQLQRYYYDYYGLPYKYVGVAGDSVENYHISENENSKPKYDYAKLLHILDNDRMNRIGLDKWALSKTWYDCGDKDIQTARYKALKNNLVNFFNRIQHGTSDKNLWTTFKSAQEKLKGHNYTKGFCPMNMRATNDFKDRVNVAYTVNRYMHPYIINFFTANNITVDEDTWALTEMLQFIWRSGIREGKEITVYIPSSRMRGILQDWIAEVSAEYNNTEI